MKFYFEGNYVPAEGGKLAKITISPSTNARTSNPIFVLIAKEISTKVESGGNFDVGFVGENKTPMIFPAKKQDSKILVMGDIPQGGHRKEGRIDAEKTTARTVSYSCGGGAWGSGSCFLAILENGQRVVSNRLIVWENKDGDLLKQKFDSLSEYEIHYGLEKIEFE